MKTKTAQVAPVQGAVATPANNTTDLFAMFQQFMAQAQMPTMPDSSVKSKQPAKTERKPAKRTEAPAKPAKTAEKEGAHIHELENSFFVYGNAAPAKLAAFFQRKPHLDRGFKEREIKGLGKVKAYWFGGRQIDKIRKELAK